MLIRLSRSVTEKFTHERGLHLNSIMRRSSFFLPALSMGLVYSSLYMGLIIVHLRGSAREDWSDPGVLAHFALFALAGLGLYFAVRKGVGRLRPLAALLALAGIFFMAVPLLPGDLPTSMFKSQPPALGLGMALFMPVSLFLFFRAAPSGGEGLFFALIMVCAEMLWALLFPLLGVILAPVWSRQIYHLFALNCWLLGIAGLCLGATLELAARTALAGSLSFGGEMRPSALPMRTKGIALGLIFAAAMGIFSMMGLHLGVMPKTTLAPELLDLPYFVLLFLLPLGGRALDGEKPGAFLLLCIFIFVGIPFLGLAQKHGLLGRMALFYLFSLLQQVMMLTMYTATARLLKTHTLLPLVLVLPHCLYPVQFFGVALRGLVVNVPYGVFAASLLLAAVTVLCLWRFRLLLAEEPKLWALPRHGGMSGFQPDYTAFGLQFGLSEREIMVVGMLAQGRSTEMIAAELKVKESTVRTYVSRLTHKTGTDSRAALMTLVAAQEGKR